MLVHAPLAGHNGCGGNLMRERNGAAEVRDARLRSSGPIVLVGMMGSGKTAVGGALAGLLGLPFHDTDDAIVEASRMTIPEIFARDGEPFFREREAEVLHRLLAQGPGVVSTGGGVFMRDANRDAIRAAGVSVWLRADPDLLWSRVRGRGGRPLLAGPDPKDALARLARERAPHYGRAEIVVDCEPDLSIDATALRVAGALRRAGRLEAA